MTLLSREAFLKKNYFSNNMSDPEMLIFTNLFDSRILLNIRTYDENSVILYANDHFNNFIHIYITEGKMVTFLFNYANEIKKLSVNCPSK